MKLIWKFNLVLIAIFLVGFSIAAAVANWVLQSSARDEILQNARLMMESALASREYTNNQVKPLLETQLKYVFLPQTVPAFAATEQFNELRKKHTDYVYKEATLNPTNPRDRATEWEAEVVNAFRGSPTTAEIVGERETPNGRSLYLARPIQIKNPACLDCHTTPEMAPKTMVDLYGSSGGFGWKLNEIVGAQIISVPMAVAFARAKTSFRVFLYALAGVFLVTLLLLNVMLHVIVTRRITRLARLADQVSLGTLDAGEFRSRSKDEIGVLTEALARMKTSLVQALKMLDN